MLKVCQNKLNLTVAAPFLIREGEQEAQAGNIENAITTFQTAFKWNPTLKFDPKIRAIEFANIGKAKLAVNEPQSSLVFCLTSENRVAPINSSLILCVSLR
ncbi:MAG: hypothetical protein RMY28_019025 [Nostoc sp. ChiSLP01]|nr:hypothetical protein [Nostoc sp. CmiSLP01]MDZ8287191.1 hypothetical protein [Nostoc sp. ChiSLP01]